MKLDDATYYTMICKETRPLSASWGEEAGNNSQNLGRDTKKLAIRAVQEEKEGKTAENFENVTSFLSIKFTSLLPGFCRILLRLG